MAMQTPGHNQNVDYITEAHEQEAEIPETPLPDEIMRHLEALETFGDSHWDVRSTAAKALGKIRDVRAVPALSRILLEDTNPFVRSDAAIALGDIGDASAIDAMQKALKDSEWEVRFSTVNALGKMGTSAVPALIGALNEKKRQIRFHVVEALGEIGDVRAVTPLTEILKESDSDIHPRIVEALIRVGTPAVPALTKVLHNGNAPTVRCNAARVLGEIGNERAVPALIDILKENDHSARTVYRDIVQALVKIGTPAVTALREALDDGEWAVLSNIMLALHEDSIRRPMPGFIEILQATAPALRESLKKSEWAVLSNIIPNLSESHHATSAVTEILKTMKPALLDIVKRDSASAHRVIEGLGQIGAPAIFVLTDILKDESASARGVFDSIVQTLRRMGEPALAALIDINKSPAEYHTNAYLAQSALVMMGEPTVPAILAHSNLTPTERLDILEMIWDRVNKSYPTPDAYRHKNRHSVQIHQIPDKSNSPSIRSYCQRIVDQKFDARPEIVKGAREVLQALQWRAEGKDLVRGAKGQKSSSSPDELLRVQYDSTPEQTRKLSILDRLFGRR